MVGDISWCGRGTRSSHPRIHKKPGLANTDYEAKYGCPVYAVYVKQKVDSEDTFFSNVTAGGFSAYVPAYELCKLEHLKQYGVRIERL